MDVAIIGAGLAGLSAAHFLREHDLRIFEATERPGGLLKSEKVEGYVFDIGGSHIIFSRDPETLREMVSLFDHVSHIRRTLIHYKGRLIEYPFENGIYALPKRERFEILRDFVQNMMSKKGKPANLLDWFLYVFGERITESYLKPYNEKIWKRDLREIRLDWVDRVPNPPIDDVLRAAVGIRTHGYTHQLRFFYPLEGGIETFARSLADGKNITCNERAKIRFEDGKPVVSGEVFDVAVYTAPLSEVPELVEGGREVRRDADKLDYNSLTVVGIGCKGRLPNFHWLYVPDEDIVFHRLANLSNYSPYMSPEGRISLIAEISHVGEIRGAESEVAEGIEKLGFDVEIEVIRSWTWKYAYVVFTGDSAEAAERIRRFLLSRRCIPFGRFGYWDYLNMDGVWKAARGLRESVGRYTQQRQR
ncbi:MAG: FAD-dependent oxidoreductase [Archaeoglobaceae archaeon]